MEKEWDTDERKEYHKLYCKQYYYANRKKILEGQRLRRQNPEFRKKMKKYYREYYRVNREKILQQSRWRRNCAYPKKTIQEPKEKCIEIRQGTFTITFD